MQAAVRRMNETEQVVGDRLTQQAETIDLAAEIERLTAGGSSTSSPA